MRPRPTDSDWRKGLYRLVVLTTLVGVSALAHTADLGDLAWNKRVILVLDQSDSASQTLNSLSELTDRRACEIRDRDLAIYFVDEQRVKPMNPEAPILTGTDAETLRMRYGRTLNPGLELVLIGKDTGVKERADDLAALEAFFDLIDTMPMRRSERAARGLDCDQ